MQSVDLSHLFSHTLCFSCSIGLAPTEHSNTAYVAEKNTHTEKMNHWEERTIHNELKFYSNRSRAKAY